jgi:hypothetical protein
VYFKLGHGAFDSAYRAKIGGDYRIYAYAPKLARVLNEIGHFPVKDKGVYRNVKLYAVKMAISGRIFELGYIKILGKCASAEALAANINGISACCHSGKKRLPVTCRSKKLGQIVFSEHNRQASMYEEWIM